MNHVLNVFKNLQLWRLDILVEARIAFFPNIPNSNSKDKSCESANLWIIRTFSFQFWNFSANSSSSL